MRSSSGAPLLPLTALSAMLALGVEQNTLAAQRGGWDPTLLEQWLTAVDAHVPGEVDGPLGQAAGWDADELRRPWSDVSCSS